MPKSTAFLHAVLVVLLVAYSSAARSNKYYDLLEVERGADTKAIKKAFRKQALAWHPGKSFQNTSRHISHKCM